MRLDGTLAARLRSGLRLRQSGHALVVHRKGGPDPAAVALAESVAVDTHHRVVVADLPADAPLTEWQAAGRLLAGRTDGIRLVFAHAESYDTRRIGQAVAETTGAAVLAADGTPRRLAGGGLFVPRDQGAGWLRFQPGRPPVPDSRRFPKPQWEFAAADEPWSPEPGTVVEPIAGGIWLRGTGDERGIGARHWLVDRIPAGPDTLTVVLGSPGTAPVSLAATVRLWHSVLPSARAWLRFLQLGPVTLPGNVDSCGQGLADAVGERVVFYAGVPAPSAHAGDGVRVEVPNHDGTAAWQPFVTEVLYVPGVGGTPSPPILLGLRAPVPGAAQTSPGVYAYTPDTVLEVVQSGLWLRSPAEPADGNRVRRVAAAPGRAAILYDRRTPDGGARLRLLAEDMLRQLGPTLRDAFRLAPADAPGAALGWSDTDWWAAADDGTARRAPGTAGGRLDTAEPETGDVRRGPAGPADVSVPSGTGRPGVRRLTKEAGPGTAAAAEAVATDGPGLAMPVEPPAPAPPRAGSRPPLSADGPATPPAGPESSHPSTPSASRVPSSLPEPPGPVLATAEPGRGPGPLPPVTPVVEAAEGRGPEVGVPVAPPGGRPGSNGQPTGVEHAAGSATAAGTPPGGGGAVPGGVPRSVVSEPVPGAVPSGGEGEALPAGGEGYDGVPPAVVPPSGVPSPGVSPAAAGSAPVPAGGLPPEAPAGAPPPDPGPPGADSMPPPDPAPPAGDPVTAPVPPAGAGVPGTAPSAHLPSSVPALPRLLRLESEAAPLPAEPRPAPEERAVPVVRQPSPPAAGAVAPGVRVQPVPAAAACAVPPARGLAQEREWVRKKFGARFNELSGSISRVMSESPGLQAGSEEDAMDVLTDLASARLYLTGDHAAVDAAVRGATTGPHVPLARCVASGLLRLPSYRGPVLLQARATAAELLWFEEGRRTTEWSFCVAATHPSDAEPGAVDFLLWSMTARRTRLLDASVPDRVVFAPGTAFKVLRTDTEGHRPAVLLRELSASEAGPDGGGQQRVPLDDLALDGLSQALELLRTHRSRTAGPSPERAARTVPLGVPPGLVPLNGPKPPAPDGGGTTNMGVEA
ncbi:hypothetical protein SHL15_8375 [Streptomyces hygroscopicus subsp. limoneus]|nr:hypothetical protein SHL15_8375 [Streptomyces hygroscopicus subsp. limoneus]